MAIPEYKIIMNDGTATQYEEKQILDIGSVSNEYSYDLGEFSFSDNNITIDNKDRHLQEFSFLNSKKIIFKNLFTTPSSGGNIITATIYQYAITLEKDGCESMPYLFQQYILSGESIGQGYKSIKLQWDLETDITGYNIMIYKRYGDIKMPFKRLVTVYSPIINTFIDDGSLSVSSVILEFKDKINSQKILKQNYQIQLKTETGSKKIYTGIIDEIETDNSEKTISFGSFNVLKNLFDTKIATMKPANEIFSYKNIDDSNNDLRTIQPICYYISNYFSVMYNFRPEDNDIQDGVELIPNNAETYINGSHSYRDKNSIWYIPLWNREDLIWEMLNETAWAFLGRRIYIYFKSKSDTQWINLTLNTTLFYPNGDASLSLYEYTFSSEGYILISQALKNTITDANPARMIIRFVSNSASGSLFNNNPAHIIKRILRNYLFFYTDDYYDQSFSKTIEYFDSYPNSFFLSYILKKEIPVKTFFENLLKNFSLFFYYDLDNDKFCLKYIQPPYIGGIEFKLKETDFFNLKKKVDSEYVINKVIVKSIESVNTLKREEFEKKTFDIIVKEDVSILNYNKKEKNITSDIRFLNSKSYLTPQLRRLLYLYQQPLETINGQIDYIKTEDYKVGDYILYEDKLYQILKKSIDLSNLETSLEFKNVTLLQYPHGNESYKWAFVGYTYLDNTYACW